MERAIEAAVGTSGETPQAECAGATNLIGWRKLLFDVLLIAGFLLMSSWLVRP